MSRGNATHVEYSAYQPTFQQYPEVLNKIGDKITVTMKDADGTVYNRKAEIIAIYGRYVLLLTEAGYRTTVHVTDFAEYKGAKVCWTKNTAV